MALSLQSYAVLPSKVQHLSFSSLTASRFMQRFDSNEVRALSSLIARHGGTVLDPACASGEVRVRVRADAEPECQVTIMHHAHGYKASVQEVQHGIDDNTGSTPVAGGRQRPAHALLCSRPAVLCSRPAVRAIVILSRCDAKESVELLSSNCAPVVVVVAVDWLFHCCVASALRSPFLYAAPPAPKPLSSVHATSSGTACAPPPSTATLAHPSIRNHRRAARAPHPRPAVPRRLLLPQPGRALHAPHRAQRQQRRSKQP